MKAAGILFIANGRALLLKRDDGYWGLPGGHLEPGETAEEAAVRETLEECQYQVEHPLRRYAEAVSPQVTFTTFLCRVPDEFKPVLNHEHTDYLWTSWVPNRTHPMLTKILQGLLMEKTYTSEFLKRFDVAKMKRLGYLVCSDVKNPEGTYTVVYRKRTGDASPESLEKKIAELSGSLGLAREKRRMKTGGAQHYQSQREMDLSRRISELRTELHNLRSSKDAIEGIVYKTLAEAKIAAERTGGKVEQKFDTSKEPPYNTYWVVKPATKDVFKEEEHPREGGKFTSKGGSSKGSSEGVTEASVKSATGEYNQALAEYRQAHQKMEGALQEAAKGFSSNPDERWNQVVKFKKDYLKPHEQKLNKAEKKANEAITALSKADGKNRPLVGFKGTPGGRFG